MPFTDVVPGPVRTDEGPDVRLPTDPERPPPSHPPSEHEMDVKVDMPRAGWGVLGNPFSIATATPCPPPVPTASHDDGVEQDTAVSSFVLATMCAAPGLPPVTATTPPSPLTAVAPTASHQFEVGHEMLLSTARPVTGRVAVIEPGWLPEEPPPQADSPTAPRMHTGNN